MIFSVFFYKYVGGLFFVACTGNTKMYINRKFWKQDEQLKSFLSSVYISRHPMLIRNAIDVWTVRNPFIDNMILSVCTEEQNTVYSKSKSFNEICLA